MGFSPAQEYPFKGHGANHSTSVGCEISRGHQWALGAHKQPKGHPSEGDKPYPEPEFSLLHTAGFLCLPQQLQAFTLAPGMNNPPGNSAWASQGSSTPHAARTLSTAAFRACLCAETHCCTAGCHLQKTIRFSCCSGKFGASWFLDTLGNDTMLLQRGCS